MSPAKAAVTGTEPTLWLTEAMAQPAEPAELVVALQLWALLPEPRVKVTVLLGRATPLVVSVPDNVAG